MEPWQHPREMRSGDLRRAPAMIALLPSSRHASTPDGDPTTPTAKDCAGGDCSGRIPIQPGNHNPLLTCSAPVGDRRLG
jgi:hypothetical protein